MMIDQEYLCSMVAFEDSGHGRTFVVPVASLLQALAIAEQQHLVPPFPVDFRSEIFPKVIDDSIRHLEHSASDVDSLETWGQGGDQ